MYLDYSYRSKTSRIERNYLIDIGKDSLSSIRLGFSYYPVTPDYIRTGKDPLETSSKAIQTTTQNVGYYAHRGPNLSKALCSYLKRRVVNLRPIYAIRLETYQQSGD